MISRKNFFKVNVAFWLLSFVFISSCDRKGTEHDTHAHGHIYVLNQTAQTIYVYNDTDLTIKEDSFDAAIPQPHWLEFAPDGQFYYVVSRIAPGHIAKFDAATNALNDTITMSGNVFPTSLAITANGLYGYLCDFTLNTLGHIHKYDLGTMAFVDSSISNGEASHDLMFTSDHSKLVACSRNTDDVTIVDIPSDSVLGIFPLDTNNYPANPAVHWPYGVHIDHNDSLAYITCLKSGQVKVFDLYSRKVVDSILIPTIPNPTYDPNAQATGPSLSVISHDDSKIYVTTQWGNSLVVANTSTGSILADIPFSTPRPFGVKLNHDGSRVFVACANVSGQPGRLYVIDGINLVKLDSVDVGLNSYGLYWHHH